VKVSGVAAAGAIGAGAAAADGAEAGTLVEPGLGTVVGAVIAGAAGLAANHWLLNKARAAQGAKDAPDASPNTPDRSAYLAGGCYRGEERSLLVLTSSPKTGPRIM